MDFRGDPSAALLEVLDPEQNNAFTDHYLGVPFDLTEVMFITTANLIDPILPALRDRMEVIEIPGYTEEEKLGIAQKYLIPRQTERTRHHRKTHPRSRSRRSARSSRTTRARPVSGTSNARSPTSCGRWRRKSPKAKTQCSHDRSGQPAQVSGRAEVRSRSGTRERRGRRGDRTGLDGSGGDVLYIEATVMKGKGQLTLTGHLGDVMKESAQAALSYVRSRERTLGINPDIFAKHDIHIHVPAGAIPKDGPSAGITMATAIASALAQIPVRRDSR